MVYNFGFSVSPYDRSDEFVRDKPMHLNPNCQFRDTRTESNLHFHHTRGEKGITFYITPYIARKLSEYGLTVYKAILIFKTKSLHSNI